MNIFASPAKMASASVSSFQRMFNSSTNAPFEQIVNPRLQYEFDYKHDSEEHALTFSANSTIVLQRHSLCKTIIVTNTAVHSNQSSTNAPSITIPDPETCVGAHLKIIFVCHSSAHYKIQCPSSTDAFRIFDWSGRSVVYNSNVTYGGRYLWLHNKSTPYTGEVYNGVRKIVTLISANGKWLAFGDSDWDSNYLTCLSTYNP